MYWQKAVIEKENLCQERFGHYRKEKNNKSGFLK